MLKVCPLIDVFFSAESDWKIRAEKIAECGFEAVETWGGGDLAQLRSIVSGHVELVSVVIVVAGEVKVGPLDPGNRNSFLERVDRVMDNALAVGGKRGIVTAGQQLLGVSHAYQRKVLTENLDAIMNSDVHRRLGLQKGEYILLSAHREENIDTEKNFVSLFTAINKMAEKYNLPILYSCHPRSR